MIGIEDIDRIISETVHLFESQILTGASTEETVIDEWLTKEKISNEAIEGLLGMLMQLTVLDYESGEVPAEVTLKGTMLMAFTIGWMAAKQLS